MSVLQTGIAAPTGGYEISRSVRLRSSASAYFNRTPASTTNRDTWTWSGWVKRGGLSSLLFLFQQGADQNNSTSLCFNSNNTLEYNHADSGAVTDQCTTSAVFRDVSAWYHIVVAVDTTQATDTNRVKLYVNGNVQTLGTANYPAQNVDTDMNTTNPFRMGAQVAGTPYYFDGYLTEINFIDGQALTPSSFGETDSITGVWKPKKYAGTYGTNGFYLNFSDNSNNTAATIGKDYSGNGNNWTPNNISVTSGTTYDSMLDTPTPYADGGNGRGNYCVINPLDKNTNITIADGSLKQSNSTNVSLSKATIAIPSSGGFYWEAVNGTLSSASVAIGVGVGTAASSLTSPSASGQYDIQFAASIVISNNGGSTGVAGTCAANDVLQVAADATNGKVWVGKNNSWYDSSGGTTGNPSTGANPTFTVSPVDLLPIFYTYNNSLNANFGQRPFAYTPPTGFKALNTQNLPDATIKKGSAYFDATTYTGTGATQTIVNSGGMQPDFVWTKARSAAIAGLVYDSVRGATKYLQTNSTGAEGTGADSLTAFATNGFTVGADTSTTGVNQNTTTYVGWQWKAGGTAVSNTAGSITSSVSAGVSQGFSVVQFTATGSNATVGHGLGVAPAMVIVKDAASTGNWAVYHKSLPSAAYYLYMNTTAAQGNVAAIWNNTAPTSTVFSVGTWHTADQQIALCFAEVAGFSKFGSYVANGSSDGVFVHLGFRPKFVMVKGYTGTSSDTTRWLMLDSSRDTYNATQYWLYANLSNAEATLPYVDFLSNGFKLRDNNLHINQSGISYVYMAFAENPFKNSLAR